MVTDPKTSEDSNDGEPFPVESFWEEWRDSWEGEIPADLLGADQAGRFAAIEAGIRAGLIDCEAQWTIVRRDKIAELVTPLRLDDPEPVIDQLWHLAGRHLRPVHRKLLGSDLASTAKLLRQVTKAAAELERLLDLVPPVSREFLEGCYKRLPSGYRHGDALDITALDFTLSNLAHTTHFAQLTLTRERKQPPKVLRQMTLKGAVDIIESGTGKPLTHSWKKDEMQAVFKGAAGKVLRDFMKLVEPRSSERALVEDLIKIRKLAKAAI